MEKDMKKNENAMELLEGFIRKAGLSEQQAVQLMRGALEQRMQVMDRARQVVAAMEALEDARFTPETLRANPEALRAVEDGMGIGEVYRRYFLGEKAEADAVQETEGNLGLGTWYGGELTPQEIERINAYVSKTGKSYEMD